MELRTLSDVVSGRLSNPFVLTAVVLWSVILVLVCASAAAAWARSRRAQRAAERGRGVVGLVVAVLLFLLTPSAISVGVSALYALRSLARSEPVASIHFQEGPLIALAWIVLPWLSGVAAWILATRRSPNPDTRRKPGLRRAGVR